MSYNQTKINQWITAPELRVLSDSGENLGIMSREDALKLAKEKGLDLIEVTSSAKPPIARIMSFDKFRYEESKKLKKQQSKQKNTEVKQVQISVRAAKNDLEIKAKKTEEFLSKGHMVTLVLVLRGREKYNKDWAKFKLQEFLKMINMENRKVSDIKWGMRGMIVQIFSSGK